jgi:ATP-dependent NAD(P)H-hydrate dehydratase
MEFARLCEALHIDTRDADSDEAVKQLAKALGCTVLEKGKVDRVSNGE